MLYYVYLAQAYRLHAKQRRSVRAACDNLHTTPPRPSPQKNIVQQQQQPSSGRALLTEYDSACLLCIMGLGGRKTKKVTPSHDREHRRQKKTASSMQQPSLQLLGCTGGTFNRPRQTAKLLPRTRKEHEKHYSNQSSRALKKKRTGRPPSTIFTGHHLG